MLQPGELAPEFCLPVIPGGVLSSARLAGQRYVLYFYPADDTPGCTQEACGFRDRIPRFEARGVPIFGVSPQGVRSHEAFLRKHRLGFSLLADEGCTLAEAYGAWAPKIFAGLPSIGIHRSTFLVGGDGRIEMVWPKVKPEGHAAEVLAYLEARRVAAPRKGKAGAESAKGELPKRKAPRPRKKAIRKKAAPKKPKTSLAKAPRFAAPVKNAVRPKALKGIPRRAMKKTVKRVPKNA
jgi:peroxiredoxin Q/BCP